MMPQPSKRKLYWGYLVMILFFHLSENAVMVLSAEEMSYMDSVFTIYNSLWHIRLIMVFLKNHNLYACSYNCKIAYVDILVYLAYDSFLVVFTFCGNAYFDVVPRLAVYVNLLIYRMGIYKMIFFLMSQLWK